MSGLHVSRLISDHMILQHSKPVHLWGKADPGKGVKAVLSGEDAVLSESATADEKGDWSLFLPSMKPSDRPHELEITDEAGGRIVIRDVLIGEVWFASGQSNMDLMMERVRDRYPDEIRDCDEPRIRCFKIAEHTDYHGPLAEPLTGEWMCASRDTIMQFSATGYFFSKTYLATTGIPVGFLHASLGGSCIWGWMNREMLASPSDAMPKGYTDYLDEAARYADDSFLAGQIALNEKNAAAWNAELERREKEGHDLREAKLNVPCFFRDMSELRGFIGKISIKKRFVLTDEMLKNAAYFGTGSDGTGPDGAASATAGGQQTRIRLFLGTLVDRDEVFINGTKVGETGYQYPPRKYDVPLTILRAGENEVEIRLGVETGAGRLTPDKKYSILCERGDAVTKRDTGGFVVEGEDGVLWDIDLSGEWTYRILARMEEAVPPTDFVNWHPTGLYNGMAAPCIFYTIDGFLWYQGEANADFATLPEDTCQRKEDYEDLMRRLIHGWRDLWNTHSEMEATTQPFLYVMLPNFTVDLDERGKKQWALIRKQQEACLNEPLTAMVNAVGLGCDNDLHPHEKEEIGTKLAALALEIKGHI